VLKEIDSFMTDLMDQNVSRFSLERCIAIHSLTGSISSLEESLYDWVKSLVSSNVSVDHPLLTHSFTEGLHVTLLTLIDTMEEPDSYNLEILTSITSDRGEMMEEIRKSIFHEESVGAHHDQQTLYSITTIYERLIWLMRRMSNLLTTIHVNR